MKKTAHPLPYPPRPSNIPPLVRPFVLREMLQRRRGHGLRLLHGPEDLPGISRLEILVVGVLLPRRNQPLRGLEPTPFRRGCCSANGRSTQEPLSGGNDPLSQGGGLNVGWLVKGAWDRCFLLVGELVEAGDEVGNGSRPVEVPREGDAVAGGVDGSGDDTVQCCEERAGSSQTPA